MRLVLVALLAAPLSFAQTNPLPPPSPDTNRAATRAVEGVISDSAGSPVRDAIVQLKDTKSLQVRSYITQEGGAYHFYGLSTDANYELRALKQGQTTPTKTITVFDNKGKVKLDLKLKQSNSAAR